MSRKYIAFTLLLVFYASILPWNLLAAPQGRYSILQVDSVLKGEGVPFVDVRAHLTFALALDNAAGKILLVASTVTISDNTTIPDNVTVLVLRGGSFSIVFGKVLTINGPFNAGAYQVFSGAGTVSFANGATPVFYAEWWGAKADNSTDSTAAITSLWASATGAQMTPLPGIYKFSNLAIPNSGGIVGPTGMYPTYFRRITGSTGTAITDGGNAGKITLKNFILDLNSCAGDGIRLGYGAGPLGSQAEIDMVFVQNTTAGGEAVSGSGFDLYGNVAYIGRIFTQYVGSPAVEIAGTTNYINHIEVAGDNVNSVLISSPGNTIGSIYIETGGGKPLEFTSYGNRVGSLEVHTGASTTVDNAVTFTGASTYFNQIGTMHLVKGSGATLTNAANDRGILFPYKEWGAYSQVGNPHDTLVISTSMAIGTLSGVRTVVASGLSDNITLTLPRIESGNSMKQSITVVNLDNTYKVTVARNGSDSGSCTIAGEASFSLGRQYQAITLQATESKWIMIGGNDGTSVAASSGTITVKSGNGSAGNTDGFLEMIRGDGTRVYVPYILNPTP